MRQDFEPEPQHLHHLHEKGPCEPEQQANDLPPETPTLGLKRPRAVLEKPENDQ
jgi:hypothetical protein